MISRIIAWVGGIAALITIVYAMLWGVPSYIDRQVEDRMKQLSADAGVPSEITKLESDVSAMKETINDIQSDVSGIRADMASSRSDNATFQAAVIQLLERQAN